MSSSSSDMWRLVQKATKIPAGFLLTSSVSLDNNKDVLKSIKAACRTEGTVAVKELMRSLLLTLTTTKTVGVKGRVLAIMDEMFWRSREFREETSAHLRVIAKHLRLLENSSRSNITTSNSGSSSSSNNSSSSSGHAGGGIGAAGAVVEDAFLQNKLKQLIVLWDGCYGQCLPELRGVVRYLSEAMKVPLPDMNTMLTDHSNEARRQQEVSRARTLLRCDQVLRELPTAVPDIEITLTEIDNIFELIFPSLRSSLDGRGVGRGSATTAPSSYFSSSSSSSSSSSGAGAGASSSSLSVSGGGIQGVAGAYVWECDGVEVCEDAGDAAVVNDGSGDGDGSGSGSGRGGKGDRQASDAQLSGGDGDEDENDENENGGDEDDVAWEEEEDDLPEPTPTPHGPSFAVPYALTLRFAVTAEGVRTDDNRALLSQLDEMAQHVDMYTLPALGGWQTDLAGGIACCRDWSAGAGAGQRLAGGAGVGTGAGAGVGVGAGIAAAVGTGRPSRKRSLEETNAAAAATATATATTGSGAAGTRTAGALTAGAGAGADVDAAANAARLERLQSALCAVRELESRAQRTSQRCKLFFDKG